MDSTDLVKAYRTYQATIPRRERLSKEGDALKQQGQAKHQEASDLAASGKAALGKVLNDTKVEGKKGGTYRPSLEHVDDGILMLGMPEDELLVVDAAGEHLFSAPDDGNRRYCGHCGRTIIYRPVKIAPLQLELPIELDPPSRDERGPA